MADIFDSLDVFDEVADEPAAGSTEMRPVMGSLKVAESAIFPGQPKSAFDVALESIAAAPMFAPGSRLPSPTTAEEVQGQTRALQEAAPYMAGAAVPEVRLGGTVARMALTGGAGAGVGKVTESLVRGELPKPAETLQATVEGMALGPILGVPLAKLGAGIAGAVGAGAGGRTRGFMAGLYRPLDEVPQQFAKSAEARERLFRATGKSVPMSVGEAAQSQGILAAEERALTSLTQRAATPTPADISKAERAVMVQFVGEAPGVSSEIIAKNAVNALESEVGPLNDAAKQSLRELADAYSSGSKGTLAEIQSRLAAELPGRSGVSLVSIGQKAKGSLMDEAKAFAVETREAFKPIRTHPEVNTLGTGSVKALKDVIRNEIPELVPDFGGEALPSAIPEGTQKYFKDLLNASDSLSLNQLINYRSSIGRSIGDDAVLPGASDRIKMMLYKAATQEIDNAIKNIGDPALESSWKAATKLYRENVDRFESRFAKSVLKDVFEGGKKPEAMAEALIGPSADTERKMLVEALGKAKAQPIIDDANKLARDQVFEASLTDDMTVMSAGKAYKAILNLPEVVRKEAFPNAGRFLDILKQELASKGLPNTDSAVKSFMDFDSAKGAEILDMLASSQRPGVEAAIRKAASAQAQVAKAEQNKILAAINSESASSLLENPSALVKGLASGKYSAEDTRKAMGIILRESPETYKQVQFAYVEDLLDTYTSKGVLNVEELASALAVPQAGLGGTTGGAARGVAESVLSTGAVSRIRDAAKELQEIRGPAELARKRMNQPSGSTRDLVARTVAGAAIGGMASGGSPGVMALSAAIGAGGGSAAKGAMNAMNNMRYKLASRILTDDRFKRIAASPYTTQNIQTAVRLAAEAIALETDDERELSDLNQIIQATSKP